MTNLMIRIATLAMCSIALRSIKSGRYSTKSNRPRAVARRAVTGFHSGSRAK